MHQVEGRRGERAGLVLLCTGGPAAALMTAVVCLVAAVLVPRGWWRPELVWPVLAVCVVPTWWLVRQIPAPGRGVPRWASLACLAIVAAFVAWAGLTHAEHVIIRRDAGAYALYAQWIGTRHGLPVTGDLSAFGGAAAARVPGFSLASPAFYQTSTGSGAAVVWQVTPQFLVGAPALYSLGWWLAGWSGVFWAPVVLAGLGLLAFAGTAVRLIGPGWTVAATGALAVTEPFVHTARSTYSEPAVLLLLMAAGGLTVAAVTQQAAGRPRLLAGLAGALLGVAGLVRVDNLLEVALLVPLCTVLAWRRHPAGLPLAGFALAGTVVAGVSALTLSRPYLDGVRASVEPLAAATVVLVLLAALVVGIQRWRAGRRRRAVAADPLGGAPGEPADPLGGAPGEPAWRLLGVGAAGVVLLLAAALTLRPLWMIDRNPPGDPAESMIASLQASQGLVIDGLRTYGEHSVVWVVWYVGPITAVAALATFAALAALAVRALRAGTVAALPGWLVPAGVAGGSVALTLARPDITPDHPWADRRLMVMVMPVVVLAAAAAGGWITTWASGWIQARTSTRPRLGATRAATGVMMAALVLPAAHATLPLAAARTEVGEPGTVAQVCAALHAGDAVAMVSDDAGGNRAQNEWVQVVRGVCGHPAAALNGTLTQQSVAVHLLTPLVHASGGQLVLLAAGNGHGHAAAALTVLGTTPVHVAGLTTREDERLLTRRPTGTTALIQDIWLGRTAG